jgi:glycopeptide antibiotics resistance protein
MTTQLAVFGILGILTTAWAFRANRRLFTSSTVGRPTILEGVYYAVGVISLLLGWYFNVRYTHQVGSKASYIAYTRALFSSWAADSAAQDYIIVNVVLLPLWTIVDGYRRKLRIPWIFFVMSLFTSLAFAMAFYLAFVERQIRYTAAESDRGVQATVPA